MKVHVNTAKVLAPYTDPTGWLNSTLRYVPPVDFPEFLESRLGKAKIMRTFITLDEYWDYRTDITYPDYDIGMMRYPLEELHFPYDMKVVVPAPSGTKFVDYLTSHSRHAQELLLNVRRYEREVSDGIITYDQYEAVFEQAVEYCKELAPNIRYIECCNEVDLRSFGDLNAEEYVAIYLRAYKAVKRLNEKHRYPIPLQLGGFSQAHVVTRRELMDGVMVLLKEHLGDDAMDFYSYHMYDNPETRTFVNCGLLELSKLSGVEKLKYILSIHDERRLALGLPERPVFLNEVGRARATGMDGDSLYNAAGNLTYLIAFNKGELGQAYPFPWCTFHNPKLQISYTQYILRDDGTYAATPNGIALEMMHSMSGNMVEAVVSESCSPDAKYCAIATEDNGTYQVLAVNQTSDSAPVIVEINGLEDGEYEVLCYRCDLTDNNALHRNGKGDGSLAVTETKILKTEHGALRHLVLLDRDCFFLLKARKI